MRVELRSGLTSGARLLMYCTENVLRFSGIEAPLMVMDTVQAASNRVPTMVQRAMSKAVGRIVNQWVDWLVDLCWGLFVVDAIVVDLAVEGSFGNLELFGGSAFVVVELLSLIHI